MLNKIFTFSESTVTHLSGSYYPELTPCKLTPPFIVCQPPQVSSPLSPAQPVACDNILIPTPNGSSGYTYNATSSDKNSPALKKAPSKQHKAELSVLGQREKSHRKSVVFSADQSSTMHQVFSKNMYLGQDGYTELAEHLGITTRQVKVMRPENLSFMLRTTHDYESILCMCNLESVCVFV